MMTTPTIKTVFSDSQIRRYLLHQVSDEERQAIELYLMENEHFLEKLNLVEADLIEDYLDQMLSPEDTELFETKFLRHPKRVEDLKFTEALLKRAREIRNNKEYEKS